MNKKYLLLASKMLSEYGDILGNQCCNDWNFPDDWSTEEKIEFMKLYHEYNGDPEEFSEDHLHLADFCVADLFSYIFAEAALKEDR